MQFISKFDSDTLEKLSFLQEEYDIASESYETLNNLLDELKHKAYKSITKTEANNMSLGGTVTVNTSVRLPIDFESKHKSIINEVAYCKQTKEDAKANLSRFKYEVIEELAIKHTEKYEALAAELSELHAFIAAYEKKKGSFNAALWNKIAVPAGTNIGRLRERADKPNGASMLCYEHKAKVLTEKYQRELKKFLML